MAAAAVLQQAGGEELRALRQRLEVGEGGLGAEERALRSDAGGPESGAGIALGIDAADGALLAEAGHLGLGQQAQPHGPVDAQATGVERPGPVAAGDAGRDRDPRLRLGALGVEVEAGAVGPGGGALAGEAPVAAVGGGERQAPRIEAQVAQVGGHDALQRRVGGLEGGGVGDGRSVGRREAEELLAVEQPEDPALHAQELAAHVHAAAVVHQALAPSRLGGAGVEAPDVDEQAGVGRAGGRAPSTERAPLAGDQEHPVAGGGGGADGRALDRGGTGDQAAAGHHEPDARRDEERDNEDRQDHPQAARQALQEIAPSPGLHDRLGHGPSPAASGPRRAGRSKAGMAHQPPRRVRAGISNHEPHEPHERSKPVRGGAAAGSCGSCGSWLRKTAPAARRSPTPPARPTRRGGAGRRGARRGRGRGARARRGGAGSDRPG